MNLLKRSLIVPSLALLLASNVYANQTYTISTSSLSEAIQQISEVANIPYIVDGNILKGKKANLVKDADSLEKALKILFKDTGLEAVIKNNTIVIRKIDQKQSLNTVGEFDVIGISNNVTEDTNSYNIDSMNTATRLNLSIRDTPQSVSVITRKKLDDLGLTSIENALTTVTGINVIPDSGKYRFQSRGFTIDQIQVEGVSNTSPGSMFNTFRTAKPMSDLGIYDHIEVVRGATGLSQGNGEPGGTINLVRKKPTKDFHASTEFAVGSNDKYRNVTDISGSLNEEETVSARLVSIFDKAKSFKDNVQHENKEIYGVFDFELGDNTVVSLGLDYQDKTATIDYYGVPTGINGKDLHLPTSTYLGADWTNEELTKKNVYLELDHYFNDNWNFETKLNYRKSNSISKVGGLANGSNTFAGVGSDGLLKVNHLHNFENESVVKSLQADVTGIYDLFGQSHELFSGVSFSKEEYNSRWRRALNSTQYDVKDFDNSQILEPNWNDTSSLFNDSDYKYRFYQNAVNLATRFNFTDKTHLLLGTRYSHFKTDGYNFDRKWGGSVNKLYPNTIINKHRFIPYLGLTYDLSEGNTLYASYTSIYKPQVRIGNDGKLLDPIIGENYELGIKSDFLDEKLKTSFAIFQINQKNRGIVDTDTNRFTPTGESRSRGFEAEVSGNITDRFMISSGYTYNKSKYLNTESDTLTKGMNFSKHTPNHMLRIYSNYNLPIDDNKWTVGLGLTSQSKTESIYNIKQGGYSLWNSSLNYGINKNMKLNLNVNNVFNKKYYLNSSTRINGMNNFYGDLRNYMLTFTWKI